MSPFLQISLRLWIVELGLVPGHLSAYWQNKSVCWASRSFVVVRASHEAGHSSWDMFLTSETSSKVYWAETSTSMAASTLSHSTMEALGKQDMAEVSWWSVPERWNNLKPSFITWSCHRVKRPGNVFRSKITAQRGTVYPDKKADAL